MKFSVLLNLVQFIALTFLAANLCMSRASLSFCEDKVEALQQNRLEERLHTTLLSSRIALLEAEKSQIMEALLSCQIKEDRQGFDNPNPLLPPLPR